MAHAVKPEALPHQKGSPLDPVKGEASKIHFLRSGVWGPRPQQVEGSALAFLP